ncbi:MAG: redoxin domain-containing protein [Planctomycetes bacterium]|nr:redoxin domain-containing protein [Planctomycetota bacterium]
MTVRRIFSTLAALAALALLAGSNSASAKEIGPGDEAPEIMAAGWINSDPLKLEALRDKIVVVEFWATWCPPCRVSIPHLVKLHDAYKDKGVVVIGLTDEGAADIASFVTKMKMTYAVGTDSGSGRTYGVRGIPTAVIVAPGGKVVWRGHPMNGLDEAVADAVKETPPVLVQPEDEARGKALLLEAEAAYAKKDYAAAASASKQVTEIKGTFDAKAKLDEIEKLAAEELKAAIGKDTLTAYREAQRIAKAYQGTPTAATAGTVADKLAQDPAIVAAQQAKDDEAKAAGLLEEAAAVLKQGNSAEALAAYEKLAADFPATKAGAEAAKKVGELKGNKDLMTKLEQEKNDKAARSLLSMAKSYYTNKRYPQAQATLKKLLESYPTADSAAEARQLLASIK